MGPQFDILIECVNENELMNETNKIKININGGKNERKNLKNHYRLITMRWQ